MNNTLAAKILISHLPEITDGAYKMATEIAIETLFKDGIRDWNRFYKNELSAREYLELTKDDYCNWILKRGLEQGCQVEKNL